jgi:hypothetical protein
VPVLAPARAGAPGPGELPFLGEWSHDDSVRPEPVCGFVPAQHHSDSPRAPRPRYGMTCQLGGTRRPTELAQLDVDVDADALCRSHRLTLSAAKRLATREYMFFTYLYVYASAGW